MCFGWPFKGHLQLRVPATKGMRKAWGLRMVETICLPKSSFIETGNEMDECRVRLLRVHGYYSLSHCLVRI